MEKSLFVFLLTARLETVHQTIAPRYNFAIARNGARARRVDLLQGDVVLILAGVVVVAGRGCEEETTKN